MSVLDRWEYLSLPVFRSRYALAAHFIPADVRLVIEVGGYKNCIGEFVQDKVVHAVDPLLQIDPRGFPSQVLQYTIPLRDYSSTLLEKTPFALVALGFDLVSEEELVKFISLAKRAEVVVIESAVEHGINESNVARILHSLEGQFTWIQQDFSRNHAVCAGYPAYYKREMVIITRKTA